MKTATLYEIKTDIALPNPTYATLLSEQELDEYAAYIKYVKIPFQNDNFEYFIPTDYWYLREYYTDYDEDANMVGVASGSYFDGPSEPNYYDSGDITEGTGTRPVVVFDEDLPCKPGDELEICGDRYTVLSPRMILLDSYISIDVFDEETSKYENAAIKTRVDNWFKETFVDR